MKRKFRNVRNKTVASPAATDSNQDHLEQEIRTLERDKLRAELRGLRGPSLLRPSNLPSLLLAIVACGGLVIQFRLLDVDRRKAEVARDVAELRIRELMLIATNLEAKVQNAQGEKAALEKKRAALDIEHEKITKELVAKRNELESVSDQFSRLSSLAVNQLQLTNETPTRLLSGFVFDAETHLPIPNLLVTYIEQGDVVVEEVTTLENGFFQFTKAPSSWDYNSLFVGEFGGVYEREELSVTPSLQKPVVQLSKRAKTRAGADPKAKS